MLIRYDARGVQQFLPQAVHSLINWAGIYIGKILREKVRFKHKRQKTRSRTREKVRFKKKSKILKLVFFSLLGRDLGFQHIHIMPSLFFAEHALPGEPGRLPR